MKIKKKWEGCKEKEFGGISGRIRKGKKRGGDEKEENGVEREREREREKGFSALRRLDRRFSSEQEAKFIYAMRATRGYQNLGVSSNSKR